MTLSLRAQTQAPVDGVGSGARVSDDPISFTAYGGRTVLTRAVADAITLADGRPFYGCLGSA